MIDQKYIDLINYEIDGIITPKQKSILDNYLKKNPQAEKLYWEMINTCKIIDEIPEIKPSDNLKKRIMNSINFNRYTEESKIKWITNQNIEWIFNPKSKMAIAFVLGMIVTFLFLTPFWLYHNKEEFTDNTNLYGTITSDRIRDLALFKQIDINLNFVKGKIGIKRFNSLFIFELDMHCHKQTDLIFQYDPSMLDLIDIKPGIGQQQINLTESFIRISDTKKVNSLICFSLNAIDSTIINFQIYQTNSLQFQQEITLNSTFTSE